MFEDVKVIFFNVNKKFIITYYNQKLIITIIEKKTHIIYSSYILVMIAMDRFQAVCYPMNNHFWQPTRSKLKIVIAWILASIMCIPQAILFVETDTDHGTKTCTAQIGNNTSTGGRVHYFHKYIT